MSETEGERKPGGYDSAPDPLSDRERHLVGRVFSDPFSFPEEFKAWLVAYLESNPPLLITGSIFGFQAAINRAITSAGSTSPIGTVEAFRFDGDPNANWMICDGRAISRTTYASYHTLASAAGYPDGAGDGTTTVNIPDFRGRMLAGKGTHADVNALADGDGVALANRSPKHKHTVTDPSHSHSLGGNDVITMTTGVATNLGTVGAAVGTISVTSSASTGITAGPQTGEPTDSPAYGVVNHIIRVK